MWRNWRARLVDDPVTERYEAALYSDARFYEDLSVGPYSFIPALPSSDGLTLGVVLRGDFHLYAEGLHPDMSATDTSRYHGGTDSDELAALMGLALGARLRSGGVTRMWYRGGQDPLGRPIEFDHQRPYLPQPSHRGAVLPLVGGDRRLPSAAELLGRFPHLAEKDAVALVRAARMHAQAIWVADDDPNLAWILLVGALEAAAQRYKPAKASKLERVRMAEPELTELILAEGGRKLAEKAAEHLVVGARVKHQFLAFVADHLPDPPPNRPQTWGRIDWDLMRQHAERIYRYRSAALHAGEPFPAPMCEPPTYDTETSSPSEKPLGNSSWSHDSSWVAEDIPMLLSTFEYIARGALVRWWATMPP